MHSDATCCIKIKNLMNTFSASVWLALPVWSLSLLFATAE